jgi:hypothetical protein
LIAPQPRKARRGTQFERLCGLSAGYCEALSEMRFGRGIGVKKRNCKLAGGAMNFGFIPSFIRLADCIEGIGDGLLRLSHSAACRVRTSQPNVAEGREVRHPARGCRR